MVFTVSVLSQAVASIFQIVGKKILAAVAPNHHMVK